MYRIEAVNDNNGWDVLEFTFLESEAIKMATTKYDNYFVRIMECGTPRKQVWENF